jgi:prevent-host-death family protein
MMKWPLSQARERLPEIVERAVRGRPQIITMDGVEVAALLSKAQYDALRAPNRPRDFKEWLLSAPPLDELDLDRDQSPPRDIEL